MMIDSMEQRLPIERLDSVPPSARICHYDELGDGAKQSFPH